MRENARKYGTSKAFGIVVVHMAEMPHFVSKITASILWESARNKFSFVTSSSHANEIRSVRSTMYRRNIL